MPCSPGSRTFLLASLTSRIGDAVDPVGRSTPPRKLDRSNDGQDHTVLPYARPACSPHDLPALSTLPEECWRDEPDSAARPHAAASSQGLPALPAPLMPTPLASTASPAREQDDTKSPLKDEPGWTTHTPFPNFGKVEYFCGAGLTGWPVFCPTGAQRRAICPQPRAWLASA